MPELTLNRNETEVLKVNIEDKTYSIPLGSSLRRKELSALNNQDAVDAFFEKHLGKELWEDLTVLEQKQILNAWSKATEEASGVKLGESSASQGSAKTTARP